MPWASDSVARSCDTLLLNTTNRDSSGIFKSFQVQTQSFKLPLHQLLYLHIWLVFLFSGAFLIRNPFKENFRKYVVARCLADYPQPPNVSNLDTQPRLFEDIWQCANRADASIGYVMCYYFNKYTGILLRYRWMNSCSYFKILYQIASNSNQQLVSGLDFSNKYKYS